MFNNKKENRHPAATEMTVVEEVFGVNKKPHNDFSTKFSIMQVLIAILSTLVLILFTVWVAVDAWRTSSAKYIPIEHKVRSGETLWNIAEEYKPDDVSMDRYMAWVYEHNDCGTIYPGDIVIMAEVTR